jgi:hypothetical protein
VDVVRLVQGHDDPVPKDDPLTHPEPPVVDPRVPGPARCRPTAG